MQIKDITIILNELSNEENAAKQKRYLRNQFEFLGISSPKRKLALRDLLKAEKKLNIIDWTLLKKLWDQPQREYQYVVIDYLTAMQKLITFDDVIKIEYFLRTKQWWDSIDGFNRIMSDLGLLDSRLNQVMLQWSQDDDFWIRRVAIDHQLLRKNETNIELLETILLNNLGSSEFFINKAIGWALRDYSKSNPDWVRYFIEKYHSKLAPLSIREASKYL
ncbi:DNA alkylation repair protein [Weissella koreensis]|uniref:DNA alkylation repair protein n=1 Tax=Weissella koreensis TaxID=165096 RepID=A0A7H1MM97_9LACO|nr:DNA alkylation repair protein [Weissella koreensis]AVH75378.1 DNA alkylation repair protein [Weissella koreensis]EJF34882.1 DNA alkylation repair enzyme [Weissella koreensis KCTC 3621]MCZ9311229.1 DNA alkylation repair protein [Weissella koreensis]QGN20604.1 DNA alkylation repair protein [Weissella koreensis]QNT64583.1 DNA alkylation repair protein [Weissella koreensis]